MPRKSSKPAASKPDADEITVDIAADVEAVEAEPMEDVIVEVVPEPEPVLIPADELVRRFSLDTPPARIAHLPRHLQKGIIQRANLWTAQGMEPHEALTKALQG